MPDDSPIAVAIGKLQDRNLLHYGGKIKWSVLSEILEVEHDTPQFRFAWLPLRDALKALGFLTSEQGTGGDGVRIIRREKSAEWVIQREKAKIRNSLKNAEALNVMPKNGLSDVDRLKIEHAQRKVSSMALESLVRMRERERTPKLKPVDDVKE